MRALVVYESMFGNTEAVARAVAGGLETRCDEVSLVDVGSAPPIDPGVDLLVVGGPTHAFSMTRHSTREDAGRQGSPVDPDRPGIREWLASLSPAPELGVATFDTRVAKVRHLPGSAAKSAAKAARRRGLRVVTGAESFYVDDVRGPLLEGELDRAGAWGAGLAAILLAPTR
ncbi:MAG TPA: hypothetical protein VFK52_12610 [Nocardioidaceae bacterium]|nr:hypothetical protein [Nocardioidaceae bacterium]